LVKEIKLELVQYMRIEKEHVQSLSLSLESLLISLLESMMIGHHSVQLSTDPYYNTASLSYQYSTIFSFVRVLASCNVN